MSNYLFLVHDDATEAPVNTWIQRHAAGTDIARAELGRGRHLVVISKDVMRSTRAGIFFRGTLVAPDDDAMVFGVEGWLAAPRRIRSDPGAHGGTYLVATWGRRHLTIDRDVFGGARLLQTTGAGFAAASDSLLVLASLRRALGIGVAPHREALLARTALNAVAGQTVSTDTIVADIGHVPAGQGLRLDRLEWRLTGTAIGRRVTSGRLDGIATVRAGARDIGRTVATLADIDGWTPNLDLSGGYDSRLVLAAVVATGTNERYTTRTVDHGPRYAGDYRVGVSLARRFGIRRERDRLPPTTEEAEDQLTLWSATLLGAYDAYGPARTTRAHSHRFGLTGLGAEIHKGQWGWRTIPQLLDLAVKGGPAREALAAQLDKGVASIGADPALRDASELYYLGYRNGVHGSAGHIGVEMTTVHPVMQLHLARLAHTPAEGRRRRPGVAFRGSAAGIADHTILLAPDVAAHEYDDPARNLDRSYIAERLRVLGGPLGGVEPLTVYGHPDSVVDGPSDLSMSIARDLDLVGPIAAEPILARAERALELLDDLELRTAYEATFDNARWRVERQGDLRLAHLSPARMSMLEVFRLAS